jgi:hypothetical protein
MTTRTVRPVFMLALCASVLAVAPSTRAQDTRAQELPDAVRRAIQEVVEEKLRVPVERWDAEAGKTTEAAATAPEVVVSGDALPESEVHAAINPLNPSNIVVSPIRVNPSNPNETLLCPVYVSTDFGASWTKSAFKTLPSETGTVLGGGDPVFAFDAGGKLYFSWIDLYMRGTGTMMMAMYWAWSADGGITWQRAANDQIGKAQLSGPASAAFDKQWLAVDRSTSPWRNTLYAAFFHPDAGGLKIGVRRKAAYSSSFTQTSVRVSTTDFKAVQFSSICVDAAGGVHVTFFGSKDSITYALWHARSDDGAVTFGPPVKISNVNMPRFSANDRQGTVPGIQNNRVYPCPHIVTDASGGADRGALYAVWAGNGIDAKGASGLDIYFSRSADNGATWSAPLVVNDDTPGLGRDQFHPSIAVNGNGVVAITWYDRRDDAANAVARYMYAQSMDGGRTFSRNLPVASQGMDMLRAGAANSNFGIGEYTQVLMTDDYLLPFWSDGRRNNGNLDVYGAFIPISAATGAERLVTVAEELSLAPVLPNPAGGTVTVRYTLNAPVAMRLTLSDALGRTVRVVREGAAAAGAGRASVSVRGLARGRYFVTLTTARGIAVQPLVVE